MNDEKRVVSDTTLSNPESGVENKEVSAPAPVSIPKSHFSTRNLGERFFLVGISASLIGVGVYYTQIADLAFNYEVEKNHEELTDEISTQSTQDSTQPSQDSTQENVEPVVTATVTSDNLNVRISGDASAEKIGTLYAGDTVTILENDENLSFVKIVFNDSEGFVHRDYLRFD